MNQVENDSLKSSFIGKEAGGRKTLLYEYLIPFFLQFGVLAFFMFIHRNTVKKGSLLMKSVTIGDEVSSPTLGRLIFMIVAFILGFFLAYVANKLSKDESKKRISASFWCGICSGMLLWQALGEDSWHFGVMTEQGFVNFCALENVSVIFISMTFLIFLAYVIRQHALSFGVIIIISSFLCNWLSHYVMLGTYPFVASLVGARTWNLFTGGITGGILVVGSIYYVIVKADRMKNRLFASMMTYIGVAVIVLAIMEG